MKNKIRTLIFDVETMPNLVRTWRKWEQNVIWYERHGYLWSISWKWYGEKKIYHKNITDFPLYKKDRYSDKVLTEFIWNLVNEADIVICHNGNAFDTKYITGRFAHHKLGQPRPYKKIDTKLLFKKYLNEDSNSLKDICFKHNLPHKLETGGEKLWQDCEHGDLKAIKKMEGYNNGDVVSLESAYLFILPFIENHPNIALMLGERSACSNCGSKNVKKEGFNYTRVSKQQQWSCKDCHSWHNSNLKDNSQIR